MAASSHSKAHSETPRNMAAQKKKKMHIEKDG